MTIKTDKKNVKEIDLKKIFSLNGKNGKVVLAVNN